MKIVAKAALSVFSGPVVEGAFSGMKDVIKKKSGKMSSELFSSIQTVRYYLKGKDTNSISLFRRPDISFSSVPSGLASRMRTAWKGSQKSWEEARHEKSEKFRQLSLTEKKLRAAAVSKRIRERALYKSNRKHLFSFKKKLLKTVPNEKALKHVNKRRAKGRASKKRKL